MWYVLDTNQSRTWTLGHGPGTFTTSDRMLSQWWTKKTHFKKSSTQIKNAITWNVFSVAQQCISNRINLQCPKQQRLFHGHMQINWNRFSRTVFNLAAKNWIMHFLLYFFMPFFFFSNWLSLEKCLEWFCHMLIFVSSCISISISHRELHFSLVSQSHIYGHHMTRHYYKLISALSDGAKPYDS